MWMLWLLSLFVIAVPASAEFGFEEKYERDYDIFNPINEYAPNNPLTPINRYNPSTPFTPLNNFPERQR